MNFFDILILFLVGAVIAVLLLTGRKNKSGCCGNCADCPACTEKGRRDQTKSGR